MPSEACVTGGTGMEVWLDGVLHNSTHAFRGLPADGDLTDRPRQFVCTCVEPFGTGIADMVSRVEFFLDDGRPDEVPCSERRLWVRTIRMTWVSGLAVISASDSEGTVEFPEPMRLTTSTFQGPSRQAFRSVDMNGNRWSAHRISDSYGYEVRVQGPLGVTGEGALAGFYTWDPNSLMGFGALRSGEWLQFGDDYPQSCQGASG